MTQATRRFITITILGVILGVAIANNVHRDLIAAIWPYLEQFAEYQSR